MIDVNVITELLIQHSQSTGFEKSLEMLTQTLRQLTDPTAGPTTLSQPVNQLTQSNALEDLLMKRLQPPVGSSVPPQAWFNAGTPPAFSSSVPPLFSSPGQRPSTSSIDFHNQHPYHNQRN